MSQTPTDRLRDYLAQLPPRSQALLMREFERSIERGEEIAVANFVLEQLRKIARGADAEARPRIDNPTRALFRPLEPFLVEGNTPARSGQIRRASLLPVWQWLAREGAPDLARAFETALSRGPENGTSPEIEAAARKLQIAAAEALLAATAAGSDDRRALSRIGAGEVIEDLPGIAILLKARETIETLGSRIPSYMRAFNDAQILSVTEALNIPSLQTPQMLPFALSLVAQRLAAPWQIIRLAIRMAASDDEMRVASTPYGMAVTIALHDLFCLAATLRADIKRSRFAEVSEHLKTLHDGVRGLRTELDLRNDSAWGRQLASIRADISSALQSEIDSVPGRVRRLLRQRTERDIAAAGAINSGDVEETAALIEFVAVCRTYAGELAINEVTMRTYSDLQHYVEQSTEALVQSLRGSEGKARTYRQTQVKAAIRFCDVLFGADYAQLMSRAAENAVTGERKSSRTA